MKKKSTNRPLPDGIFETDNIIDAIRMAVECGAFDSDEIDRYVNHTVTFYGETVKNDLARGIAHPNLFHLLTATSIATQILFDGIGMEIETIPDETIDEESSNLTNEIARQSNIIMTDFMNAMRVIAVDKIKKDRLKAKTAVLH